MTEPIDPEYGIEIPDFPELPSQGLPPDFRDKLMAVYKAMALVLAGIIQEIQDRPRPDIEPPAEVIDGIRLKLLALKAKLESMPRPEQPIAPTPEPKR